MNTMFRNGVATTATMMHAALNKLVEQAGEHGADINDVQLTVRTNSVSGRHVHASGSVRLRFDACIVEPEKQEDARCVE